MAPHKASVSRAFDPAPIRPDHRLPAVMSEASGSGALEHGITPGGRVYCIESRCCRRGVAPRAPLPRSFRARTSHSHLRCKWISSRTIEAAVRPMPRRAWPSSDSAALGGSYPSAPRRGGFISSPEYSTSPRLQALQSERDATIR